MHVALEIDQVACDVMQIVSDAERGIVHPILLAHERLTDDILDDLEGVDPAFSDWLAETRPLIHERLIDALTKLLPDEADTIVTATAEAAARGHPPTGFRERARHSRSHQEPFGGRKYRRCARGLCAALAATGGYLRHRAAQTHAGLDRRLAAAAPEAVARPVLASVAAPTLGLAGLVDEPTIGRRSPLSRAVGNSGASVHDRHRRQRRPGPVKPEGAAGDFPGSTMIPMPQTLDLRAIGRDLNAQYLLHGSIQRAGDMIRISTELVAAETVEVVRADRLSGTAADVFDLQDRIAVEVIRSLAPQVRDRELHRAMQKRPDDLDAYQLALVGYDQMFSPDYTTFVTARTNFERAHVLSPNWAPPLSYSAIWHMQRVARGWSANALNERDTARALAERALERNSADPLANAVGGYTLSQCKHDHIGALKQARPCDRAHPEPGARIRLPAPPCMFAANATRTHSSMRASICACRRETGTRGSRR